MQCERPETTGNLLLLLLLTLLIVVGSRPARIEDEKRLKSYTWDYNPLRSCIKMKLNPTPGTAILYIQTKILHTDAKTR